LWLDRSPNFFSFFPAVSNLILQLYLSCTFFKSGNRRILKYTPLCGTLLGKKRRKELKEKKRKEKGSKYLKQ